MPAAAYSDKVRIAGAGSRNATVRAVTAGDNSPSNRSPVSGMSADNRGFRFQRATRPIGRRCGRCGFRSGCQLGVRCPPGQGCVYPSCRPVVLRGKLLFGLADMVGLQRPTGQKRVRAFRNCVAKQKLKLACLIAACRKACTVITLDPDLHTSQRFGKTGRRFEGRRQMRQPKARSPKVRLRFRRG